MQVSLKREWCQIAILFSLVLLLRLDGQAASDPCVAVKTELSAATKARDQCLARVQKADETCEGSKVAVNLRESLKKKEESLNQYVKKNSAINTELMECQEVGSNTEVELQRHEQKKTVLDKRLMETKDKLTKCEDQVAAFGPDDASEAQQQNIFLRKQVKNLQETNTEQSTTYKTLQTDMGELRIKEAICQSNYTLLKEHHYSCDTSKVAVKNEYEDIRTVLENNKVILAVILTILLCLATNWFFNAWCDRNFASTSQKNKEMLRRQSNDTLAITGGVFDVTFVDPPTPARPAALQHWFKKIEQGFKPHGVTINPQKLTKYDPQSPPPSKSVIFMSEKPEGSKFFCINQAKKEYFHIADNKELIEFAKKKYEKDA